VEPYPKPNAPGTPGTEEPGTERGRIRELKTLIKGHALALNRLKQCRRTVHGVPREKAAWLKAYLGDDDAERGRLPHEIDRQRRAVTVAHLLYGELRGRLHDVREPERFEMEVESLRSKRSS
jgi:hypothetical protein